MTEHQHVRCTVRDNRHNRAIESQYGFDRLFGVSKRTYIGNHTAIALLERNIARTVGYSTVAWPEADGVTWTLTVLRDGRKD